MNQLEIFEPAMCCDTGLCGVGVDPELLRISTLLNSLKKNEVVVKRFNLTSAPLEFINNKKVSALIQEKGIDILPLAVLNGEITITGRYPTNEEFIHLLNIPAEYIANQIIVTDTPEDGSCCCNSSEDSCCDSDESESCTDESASSTKNSCGCADGCCG